MSRAFLAAMGLCALVPLAASAAALPPAPAPESRLELHGRTLFLPMEETAAGLGAGWPLFQFVELAGYDLTTPGLSAHTAVWGAAITNGESDPITGDPITGDVDLLFVQYRDPKGRMEARAGRQLVLGSATGTGFFGHVDGGWLRVAADGFSLEGFGGQTVEQRFRNWGQYDLLGGGRAGFHQYGMVNGGVSYLHARNDGRLARELAGADLSLSPLRWLDLVAASSYDLVDPGLAESRALVRVEPVERLVLGAGVEQGSPGRLVDKSSIFSVFSLGDWAQGELMAEYAITPQWSVRGRWARVWFPSAEGDGFGPSANRYGGGIATYPHRRLWLSLDAERLPSEDNGYGSARLASRWTVGRSYVVAADLLAYFYDEPPLANASTATQSLVGRLFFERRVVGGLSAGIGGEVAQTAFADVEVRGTALLTQDFEIGGRR